MVFMKYCVFVDVLGYGNIITSDKSENQKLNILNSIYSNLASHIMIDVNYANQNASDPIYIKSFSDCFYLESSEVNLILHSIKSIFRNAFTYYGSEEDDSFGYTALFRSGLTKNWTRKFMDLASMVNNNSTMNPVGLGVAESYYISEKSFLSGMRIIINKSVFKDIPTSKISIDNIDYFKHEYTLNGADYISYLKKINRNELFKKVDLYELIWSFDTMNTCTTDGIDTLKNIKHTFGKKQLRHYKKTAEILYHGLKLTNCKSAIGAHYESHLAFLEKEMHNSFISKIIYFISQFIGLKK